MLRGSKSLSQAIESLSSIVHDGEGTLDVGSWALLLFIILVDSRRFFAAAAFVAGESWMLNEMMPSLEMVKGG